MKAPPFDYTAPRTLAQALALLAEHGDEARLLAGGQSLLATLNMRLSEPSLLIDIGRIDALKGIAVQGNLLRIGALTTHSQIEASPLVALHAPLLAQAAPHIAHRAIRNLGTLGGSVAHADPAAEWPACLVAADATVVVQGTQGERRIAAADFFVDLYTTALVPGEIVTACECPLSPPDGVADFDELARRHGDYAIVGLALTARRADLALRSLRLVFMGLGNTPVLATQAADLLEGQALTPALIDAAVAALQRELQPMADLTHSAAAKRHLAGVLARRALSRCLPADATPNAASTATRPA